MQSYQRPQTGDQSTGSGAGSCDYTVQPGDTLWDISRRYRGGGRNWPGLYEQNAGVVGGDPNLIQPGQQLNVCAPTPTPGVAGPQPLADDDYAGQIDRVRAQQELASQFQVVPDDFVGPRLPNQVTSAEFERLASNYSDIRRGRTNIQMDTTGMNAQDAAKFKDHTMGDLGHILTTQSGRDLLNQLSYGTNPHNGNAYTTTIRNDTNPTAAGTNNAPGSNAADMGNGVGCDQVVNYAAGQDTDLGATIPSYESAQYRNFTSDTILFHELTHAMHRANGDAPIQTDASGNFTGFTPVGGTQATFPGDASTAQEEYNTVGLGTAANDPITENRYREERSLVTGTPVPQRNTYAGPGPLPPAPTP